MTSASLELPKGIKTKTKNSPEISRYFNESGTPYTNTSQVLLEVSVRYIGQVFNVNKVEYHFGEGIEDEHLVIKHPEQVAPDLSEYQPISEKGEAEGYAGLDSSIKLPIANHNIEGVISGADSNPTIKDDDVFPSLGSMVGNALVKRTFSNLLTYLEGKISVSWNRIMGSQRDVNLIGFEDGTDMHFTHTVISNNNWFDITTDKKGVWIGVSWNGTNRIIKSIDDGNTWIEQPTPEQNQWLSIKTDEVGVWVCVANSGTNRILKSIDNGETWTVQGLNAHQWVSIDTDKKGTWITSATNGGNPIARSTDNGETWTLMPSPGSTSLGLVSTDGNGIWIIAQNNKKFTEYLRSDDNGETWTVHPIAETTIVSAFKTNGSGVWMNLNYLDDSQLIVSTDHGLTWDVIQLGVRMDALAHDGDRTWIAVTYDNNLIKSVDNGVTWELHNEYNNYSFGSIATDSKGKWVGLSSGLVSVSTSIKFENIVNEYRHNGKIIPILGKVLDIKTENIEYQDSDGNVLPIVGKVLKLPKVENSGDFTEVSVTSSPEKLSITDNDQMSGIDSVTGKMSRWKWSTAMSTISTLFDSVYVKISNIQSTISNNAQVLANTAKVGITPTQATAITTNTAKVGITPTQATAITNNTAKLTANTANVSSAGAVMKSGNQSVSDVITFEKSPIVPTPTTDMQVVNKAYVDNQKPTFTTQEITSGGNYNNLEVTADLLVFKNENAQAILNGVWGKKDFHILNLSTKYEVRVNHNSPSITGNGLPIKLPTAGGSVGVKGTARVLFSTEGYGYFISDTWGSLYRPEFKGLTEEEVVTVNQESNASSKKIVELKAFRDVQNTNMTKSELNIAYPTAVRGFEVICKTINKSYLKVDNNSNDWVVINNTNVS